MAALEGLTRPITLRSVHLHIRPRPQCLSHTSDILSVLRRYGPVEYFKHLKHDPSRELNSILCIYREDGAARALLSESPLSIPIDYSVTTHLDSRTDIENHTRDDTDESTHSHADRDKAQKDANSVGDKVKGATHFRVIVNRSTFPHQQAILHNEYHGPFRLDRKSVVQSHLAKRVPMIGMSEINVCKPSMPSRTLKWQMAREEKTRLPPLRELLNAAKHERNQTET